MSTISVEIAKPVSKAWGKPKGIRQGIMLHYDASRSDVGAVAWLEDDERARASYHYLVLDDGRILQIAPPGSRAWHAGVCRPSRKQFTYTDGNNAFYGIAIAATQGEVATPAQKRAVTMLCHYLFWLEGWSPLETWRITGHSDEAWPRGRKLDPHGVDDDHPTPVMEVGAILALFAASAWTGIP